MPLEALKAFTGKATGKAIANSTAWSDEVLRDAKVLQNTNPLAWWITVENFKKVHEHFKKMPADDTVKEGEAPKDSVWSYIKEQDAYPYKGLKDLSLNEVFERDVENCTSREEVEEWGRTNSDHANKENILKKLNTYKIATEEFKAGVNAYDMTNYCSIPSTRTTGLGVAMHMHTEAEIKAMKNIQDDPNVQPQVMLSHAWTEDMDEVMGILEDCVKQGVMLQDGSKFTNKTRVWFCCFAIYQPFKFNEPPRTDNEELVGGNVTVKKQMDLNGFTVVSEKANDMIVIHTTKGDAYNRMWCIVELWEAIMAGKQIHMIGSKEYFSKYMTKVEGEYVLNGHPATPEGGRSQGRRDAIKGLPNFHDFIKKFRDSEAGGNKDAMDKARNEQIKKMNNQFKKGGGLKKYSEKHMALEKILGGDGEIVDGQEYNIYKNIRLARGLPPHIMERETGDVRDDGVTFVENVVAFMRLKWLQNVAKSWDGEEFKLPHWKINSVGELVAEGKGVIVETKSIDISGHRSSSGGNTRSSSFPRLANSLAEATDNMIAHSEQLEDELVAKEAIIRSQEQRIQNQNARIAALERQATRAEPTRRVTANTRTTARNRNANEGKYYC